MKRKLKIVGNAFKHCQYSNNPMPPTSISENVEWDWNVGPVEDLVFYIDDAIMNTQPNHKKRIALLVEPHIKKPQLAEWLKTNYNLFEVILMNDKEAAKSIPNSMFFPFGGCWIEEENRKQHDKTKLISIVASGKKQVPAHHMRHQIIANNPNKIDVYGRGYNPIDSISIGLNDYMFHIAMENSQRDYHFSEKIINPMMTWTVPVYYGMPSISQYFDTRGMIIFDTVEEFQEILPTLNKKRYDDMLPYIRNNFIQAQQYILGEDWLWNQGFFNNL